MRTQRKGQYEIIMKSIQFTFQEDTVYMKSLFNGIPKRKLVEAMCLNDILFKFHLLGTNLGLWGGS